jgi:hypothetical protein
MTLVTMQVNKGLLPIQRIAWRQAETLFGHAIFPQVLLVETYS